MQGCRGRQIPRARLEGLAHVLARNRLPESFAANGRPPGALPLFPDGGGPATCEVRGRQLSVRLSRPAHGTHTPAHRWVSALAPSLLRNRPFPGEVRPDRVVRLLPLCGDPLGLGKSACRLHSPRRCPPALRGHRTFQAGPAGVHRHLTHPVIPASLAVRASGCPRRPRDSSVPPRCRLPRRRGPTGVRNAHGKASCPLGVDIGHKGNGQIWDPTTPMAHCAGGGIAFPPTSPHAFPSWRCVCGGVHLTGRPLGAVALTRLALPWRMYVYGVALHARSYIDAPCQPSFGGGATLFPRRASPAR